jgi:hypothetical protein
LYAEVEHAVHVTGRSGGVDVDTTTRMDTFVQHYAMSHGMNFMLVNVVARRPLGGTASRVALTGRAGAGPMLPHAETNVGGRSREQYERAGIGFQLAGGVDVRLAGWLSAIADYKFGHARRRSTSLTAPVRCRPTCTSSPSASRSVCLDDGSAMDSLMIVESDTRRSNRAPRR